MEKFKSNEPKLLSIKNNFLRLGSLIYIIITYIKIVTTFVNN